MKALNVFCHGQTGRFPVGQLLRQNRRIAFSYDPQWLQRGFALSPYQLPLVVAPQWDSTGLWQGLHGVFNDSLPDGWGLFLMDRALRQNGLDPHQLSPLDRLAWLGDRSMGALSYEPCTHADNDPLLLDIKALAENAAKVFSGAQDEILPALFRAGGSPGGARPKALVATRGAQMITADGVIPEGFIPWLVKFNAKDDFIDAGAIEFAYSLMAHEVGLTMPETQLMAGEYFAVRRFDRDGLLRRHVHSFGNMVGADFRVPNLDYQDLLRVVLDVTKSRDELKKAFLHMLFNIATHNRDDHSKNFSFIWSEEAKAWRLSPAYDLMFSHGIHGEHTMTVAGEGKAPGQQHIQQLAQQFGLQKAVDDMLEQVNSVVSHWTDYASQAGVLSTSTKQLSSFIKAIQ